MSITCHFKEIVKCSQSWRWPINTPTASTWTYTLHYCSSNSKGRYTTGYEITI